MSMTYTKLFSSITESTIWLEPSDIKVVWITMLAMADASGCVWGSVPGLAKRAGVPLESCEEALRKFLSPDPYSRTKDCDGRRIAEIDGGWRLINHAKYRAERDQTQRKEYWREYKRRKRAQTAENVQQDVQMSTVDKVDSVDIPQMSIHADADANINTNTCPASPSRERFPSENSSVVDELYLAYPRHTKPIKAKKAIVAAIKRIHPAHDAAWLLERVRLYAEERKGQNGQFTPYPATWFNDGCYDDESLNGLVENKSSVWVDGEGNPIQ